jgi:hypothetical protein
LFTIQYIFSAERTALPSISIRSLLKRTGVSTLRRTTPFSFTLPVRINSTASDREQNPSFDSARASPVFLALEDPVFLFICDTFSAKPASYFSFGPLVCCV